MNPTITPDELVIPEHLDPDRLRSARLAATKHFMDFLMGETLGRIVERDTEARVGNGAIPVPDWTRTVTQLYECGRTIPEIVKALYDAPGVNLGAVMDALGFEFFCELCGRGVDLNDGETCWAADGDRDYPFWGVAPHGSFGFECSGGGAFVTRGNSPYIGESPMRECAE